MTRKDFVKGAIAGAMATAGGEAFAEPQTVGEHDIVILSARHDTCMAPASLEFYRGEVERLIPELRGRVLFVDGFDVHIVRAG